MVYAFVGGLSSQLLDYASGWWLRLPVGGFCPNRSVYIVLV